MSICNGKCKVIVAVYPIILIALLGGLATHLHAQIDNRDAQHIRTVVIDPGHGGRDPGAVGKHSYEKTITLGISLKLGAYIEQLLPEVKVVYTRQTDKSVPLDKRGEIANQAKADVFISIHVNSSEVATAYGTSSWVMGLHKTEENLQVAQRENSVIRYEDDYASKYEGYDPESPESFIVFSLMQNTYLEQSLQLAANIQNQLRRRVGRKDRGVRQAGFMVLWQTAMPAVLVETGFISNPKEERFLASAEGQDFIASALFRAFRDYKNTVEGSVSAPVKRPVANTPTPPKPQENPKRIEAPKPKAKAEQVWYTLQIASSAKPLDTRQAPYSQLSDLRQEKEGATYKYYLGRYPTYAQVKQRKATLGKPFADAFVVAYLKGERIHIKKALALSGQ